MGRFRGHMMDWFIHLLKLLLYLLLLDLSLLDHLKYLRSECSCVISGQLISLLPSSLNTSRFGLGMEFPEHEVSLFALSFGILKASGCIVSVSSVLSQINLAIEVFRIW